MRENKRVIRGILLTLALMMLMSVTAFANTYTMNRTGSTFRKVVYKSGYDDRNDYLKFKVSNPGLLEVAAQNQYGNNLQITLLNSAKKSIDYSSYHYGNDYVYYGVRPGTYYIKVKTWTSYSAYVKFTKKADNGRSTRAQAKTMTRNKAMSGVMSGAESYTVPDWFRIYVGSRRHLKINYDFRGSGYFKITLRNASGSYNVSTNFSLDGRKNSYFYTYGGTPTPGTYYFGITRNGKGANGQYYLRWNYK